MKAKFYNAKLDSDKSPIYGMHFDLIAENDEEKKILGEIYYNSLYKERFKIDVISMNTRISTQTDDIVNSISFIMHVKR